MVILGSRWSSNLGGMPKKVDPGVAKCGGGGKMWWWWPHQQQDKPFASKSLRWESKLHWISADLFTSRLPLEGTASSEGFSPRQPLLSGNSLTNPPRAVSLS